MKCSIVLPVYGAGALLHVAISSILAQDEPDFEFLIIDDGSPDRSVDIARKYASRDDRIRVLVHSQNQGVAATLNEGVRNARSDLILRMDADDEALPSRVRTQVEYMQANPAIAIAGSFVYHMGSTRRYDRLVTLPIESGDIARALPVANCIYHPSVIFRRSVILGLGGYRPEFKNAEDYDLWLRASKQHLLSNIPTPLLRYRFSPGGMTLGKKWEQMFYVQMALESHRSPQTSSEELLVMAEAELTKLDKQHFLEQVAVGTIDELARLRLWKDALKTLLLFSRQLDRDRRWRLVKHFRESLWKEFKANPQQSSS